MTWMYWLAGGMVAVLAIYLFVALLRPEKF
ncbi:K(+)-transporting ATPase subunit F [Chitinivorax sp. B]|nr:K(+)-transporting ATPase subunit F [Chitinivorax sp. B]